MGPTDIIWQSIAIISNYQTNTDRNKEYITILTETNRTKYES